LASCFLANSIFQRDPTANFQVGLTVEENSIFVAMAIIFSPTVPLSVFSVFPCMLAGDADRRTVKNSPTFSGGYGE
jgi:hypothetical protein